MLLFFFFSFSLGGKRARKAWQWWGFSFFFFFSLFSHLSSGIWLFFFLFSFFLTILLFWGDESRYRLEGGKRWWSSFPRRSYSKSAREKKREKKSRKQNITILFLLASWSTTETFFWGFVYGYKYSIVLSSIFNDNLWNAGTRTHCYHLTIQLKEVKQISEDTRIVI